MNYRENENKLVERVINESRLISISLLKAFSDKFPRLLDFVKNDIDTARFDYLITICLFAGAISSSPKSIPDDIFRQFSKKLQQEIKNISQDMYMDFCHLMGITAKGLDAGYSASIGIGFWFMTKYTDNNVIPEVDNEISIFIGETCCAVFSNLWKEDS